MLSDVIMFAMDRRLDRRIVLAAETLQANGFSTCLLAPADRSVIDEPIWVERVSTSGLGMYGRGLRLHRFMRDRFPFLRGTMRRLTWQAVKAPEQVFLSLFDTAISRAKGKVYVAHDLPMLPVALAAQRLHGGKVILDCHELYSEQAFSRAERQLWRSVEARYIGQADAVITVNPSIARELRQNHGLPEVHVVSNADRFVPDTPRNTDNPFRSLIGNERSAPTVLYQGGLSSGRNLDTLVAAFSVMRHTDAQLVLLGDGGAKTMLRKKARQLSISDRVHFIPTVPQKQLIELARWADLGVIPYQANCLNNELCTPNKLFEFIMARLPIVASDLPEIRRIVSGYDIGVLGSTRTPADFAALIDAALEARVEKAEMWRKNLQRAACEQCWEREGMKYLAVVRKLADDFGPHAAGGT